MNFLNIPLLTVLLFSCNIKEKQKVHFNPKEKVIDLTINEPDKTNDNLNMHKITNYNLIDINKNASNCNNYYLISDSLEINSYYKKLLSCYLNEGLIGNYKNSKKNYDSLFVKKSFIKSILYIYINRDSDNLNIYEYKSRWDDEKINLLYRCTNKTTLHTITDSLIAHSNYDGILVLWGELNINTLRNKESLNNLDSDYYNIQLSLISHLRNNLKNLDFYKAKIKDIELLEKLNQAILLNKTKREDYFSLFFYY